MKNVDEGIYRNKSFYKILKFPNIKIIQSGAHTNFGIQRKLNAENTHLKRIIPLEIAIKNSNEPIYNSQIKDPMKLNQIKHSFEKGSLAMVKVGEKSSSSTEFFFILKKSSEFDGRYSIFGKVVNGFDTLNKIEKGDIILKINSRYLNL